mmetsp:Transcript_52402/g.128067  ORF Transcript_52402/g.128067 Transcript_52402/m.128067 type:complete len:314 (-) Transcript_52402:180-1121(-)
MWQSVSTAGGKQIDDVGRVRKQGENRHVKRHINSPTKDSFKPSSMVADVDPHPRRMQKKHENYPDSVMIGRLYSTGEARTDGERERETRRRPATASDSTGQRYQGRAEFEKRTGGNRGELLNDVLLGAGELEFRRSKKSIPQRESGVASAMTRLTVNGRGDVSWETSDRKHYKDHRTTDESEDAWSSRRFARKQVHTEKGVPVDSISGIVMRPNLHRHTTLDKETVEYRPGRRRIERPSTVDSAMHHTPMKVQEPVPRGKATQDPWHHRQSVDKPPWQSDKADAFMAHQPCKRRFERHDRPMGAAGAPFAIGM